MSSLNSKLIFNYVALQKILYNYSSLNTLLVQYSPFKFKVIVSALLNILPHRQIQDSISKNNPSECFIITNI